MNDEKTSTALVVAERPKTGLLRPIASEHEILGARAELVNMLPKVLEEGVDYGVIPGTNKKNTLLKPGAERVSIIMGCAPIVEVVEQEIDHDRAFTYVDKYRKQQQSVGLYRYVVRVRLTRPDGVVAGEGVGSCSTLESKYISRPRDCENTVLKMAFKRAHVAAVLSAFGLSDRFTQDVEDMPRGDDVDMGHDPQERSRPTQAARANASGTTPRGTEQPRRSASVLICMLLDRADAAATAEEHYAVTEDWARLEPSIGSAKMKLAIESYLAVTGAPLNGLSYSPTEEEAVAIADLRKLRERHGGASNPPTSAEQS